MWTVLFKMQEKHERMKNLKSLRETESVFCERLCLPAHNLGDVTVPTKEHLKELEANVEYLRKEQVSIRTNSEYMIVVSTSNTCK